MSRRKSLYISLLGSSVRIRYRVEYAQWLVR